VRFSADPNQLVEEKAANNLRPIYVRVRKC
jgi:hypothetical protein